MTTIQRTRLPQLLRERMGWSAQTLRDINNADHQLLMGIDALVDRLAEHRVRQTPITVHPDFDTDGITAGITAYAGLAELGFDVELYIPDYRRGHDVLPEAIDEMMDRHPRTRVLLSCDNMTNSADGIARAKQRGLEVMVTDHHQQLGPCNADFLVNPDAIGESYVNSSICGAHVIWQVLDRYCQRHDPSRRGAIRQLRLFAGLGTIGDVMPIRHENRAMVRDAVAIARLLYVNSPVDAHWKDPLPSPDISAFWKIMTSQDHDPRYAAAFLGFAMLLRAFQDAGKIRNLSEVDEGFFGFYAAPMLNAIRRMGGEMAEAFRLLTDPSPVSQYHAARTLIAQNDERKQMTKDISARLLSQYEEGLQPLAPSVWLVHERVGMLGLVANSLMERYGRPTAVLALPEDSDALGVVDQQIALRGSGRAPGWFNIISELAPMGFRAVGHEQACGVGTEDHQTPRQLAEAMVSVIERLSSEGIELDARRADILISEVELPGETIDASLGDIEGQIQAAAVIEDHAPYGHDFDKPVFEVVIDLSQATIMPLGKTGLHCKITTQNNLEVIEWNSVSRVDELRARAGSDTPVARFLCRIGLNRFRGDVTIQYIIDEVLDS